MKKFKYTLVFIFFIQVLQAQLFVIPNGSGDGSSWETGGNLQIMLAIASPGEQIWVKTGTYSPTSCTVCDDIDRDIYFEIPDEVQIYGGFAGTESNLTERNWQNNPSILSGDIDGDNTSANNAYTILYTRAVSNATIIDGFIIEHGNADNNNASNGSRKAGGAGWYNDGALNGFSSAPILRNCIFQNNHAIGFGGAIFNDGSFGGQSNAYLENVQFLNNIADLHGGAMFNDGSFSGKSSPEIVNCTFTNNTASNGNGGAIYFISAEEGICEPLVSDCQFLMNTCLNSGGAIEHFGKTGTANGVYENCYFEGNSAGKGGAMYNDGSFDGQCHPQIIDCTFTANESLTGDGGALYNIGSDSGACNPSYMNCLFENNHSAFAGAAIFNNGIAGISNPTITNCRFRFNQADTYGGAIYNQGKKGDSRNNITNCLFYKNNALSAGAIYNLGVEFGNSSPPITNCSFYGNAAEVGGAIYNNASDEGNAAPIISNCIITGNIADFGHVFRNIEGTPIISYSIVDAPNCEATNNGNNGSVTCGDGMLFNVTPMYVDAEGENLRLQENSPAIDAGINTTINATSVGVDLDNYPRIFNNTVDLGTYEWGAETIDVPQITQQPQDLTVCEDDDVELIVAATAQNLLLYQWQKDGVDITGAVYPTLSIGDATLADNAAYRCIITSLGGAPTTSETAVLEVLPNLEVIITTMADMTTICSGESVYLSTEITNGGSNPHYQWYINGNPFGASIPAFSISALNDGDVFYCELTSSETCVLAATSSSNPITINIDETPQEAAIEINASTNTACVGEQISFNSTTIAGGADATFEWQINGETINETDDDFQSTNLQNGDIITCILTSSLACIQEPVVVSNSIEVNIEETVTPIVTIERTSDTLLCEGSTATFLAAIEHGGNAPYFQWKINNIEVGNNEDSFTTQALLDSDIVSCEMTSNASCATTSQVISNEIIIELCIDATNEITDNALLYIFPNPVQNILFVTFEEATFLENWRIFDAQGRLILHQEVNALHHQLVISTEAIPNGIYTFQLANKTASTYHKILIIK